MFFFLGIIVLYFLNSWYFIYQWHPLPINLYSSSSCSWELLLIAVLQLKPFYWHVRSTHMQKRWKLIPLLPYWIFLTLPPDIWCYRGFHTCWPEKVIASIDVLSFAPLLFPQTATFLPCIIFWAKETRFLPYQDQHIFWSRHNFPPKQFFHVWKSLSMSHFVHARCYLHVYVFKRELGHL